ncbi:hypothetical protein MBLNU459_g6938t1 [Dothideomycetes sp. NU459]
MNSRSLRRLAADHGALHHSPLPVNYLFDPKASDSELTTLDILIAGPTSTPYEAGVFRLHLTIPTTYPNDPPKAFFRTKIFHPNVDADSGAVCVETLKRDWDNKLSLRDVLITISCLLVQPNASSALNAEAGMLLEQGDGGWEAFEKRARLMTRLHAGVPKDMKQAVIEAQRRGEEQDDVERKDFAMEAADDNRAGKRKRKPDSVAMPETPASSMDNDIMRAKGAQTPPAPTPSHNPATRPFVLQPPNDDVFAIRLPRPAETPDVDSDSEILDANQENDTSLSPIAFKRPSLHPSPIRQGPPVPLGELSISDDSFESEYPPSPKKSPQKKRDKSFEEYPPSPRKSPQKRLFDVGTENVDQRFTVRPDLMRAESSRTASERRLLFTPVAQPAHEFDDSTMGFDDSFMISSEARRPDRPRVPLSTKTASSSQIDPFSALRPINRVAKKPTVASGRTAEEKRKENLEAKLWKLCGGDVERWNRGDFDGYFELRAARW